MEKWLGIKEFAKRAERTPSAIYQTLNVKKSRYIKQGEWYKDDNGNIFVHVNALSRYKKKNQESKNESVDDAARIKQLQEENTQLKIDIAISNQRTEDLKEINKALNAHIEDLRKMLPEPEQDQNKQSNQAEQSEQPKQEEYKPSFWQRLFKSRR